MGPDALEDQDRLILETARLLREFLIGQSAYDPADAQSPVTKTWALADAVLRFHHAARERLVAGESMASVDVGAVRRDASRRFARNTGGGPA